MSPTATPTATPTTLYGASTPARALLDRLWADYLAMNPQISAVVSALNARGETFRNDHIALRTYDSAAAADPTHDIGLERLGALWERHGYAPRGDYTFEAKGLRARHWEHPDPELPRVFISELVTARLPPPAQALVRDLVAQLPAGLADDEGCLVAGRPWPCDLSTWRTLAEASEYAGWMAAFGLRANHFTVDVGSLRTFAGLRALNAWLVAAGFPLNESGGVVKGSPAVFLEQSSTLAAPVTVTFSDGEAVLPGCYVEFAQRFAMPDGAVFSGFVADNADRIFESTDRQ